MNNWPNTRFLMKKNTLKMAKVYHFGLKIFKIFRFVLTSGTRM